MNHINRLLIQLKREVKPLVNNALCFIDRDYKSNKWICNPMIWDGKPGTGHMEGVIPADWVREYDTADEAAEAVERLFDTLNISDPERLLIIIDDLME